MKTIVITGCSWGAGEWGGDGTSIKTNISHPGLGGYFMEHGFNVVNLSRPGGNNQELILPLHAFLEINQHLNIQHIFFIQTDIGRCINEKVFFKDAELDLDGRISNLYYDLYSQLNHYAVMHDVTIHLIGGLTDLHPGNFTGLPNLNFLVPSWAKLIDNNISTTLLNDGDGFEWLDKNYAHKDQIEPYLNTALERSKYFKKTPEFFYPDWAHPNRKGHRVLYEYIKNNLVL